MTRPPVRLSLIITAAIVLVACGGAEGAGTAAPSGGDTSSPVSEDPIASPADPGPIHAWALTGNPDATAGDVDLVLSGGYELTSHGVAFDGETGFASTQGPGPLNTTASFSVAAWVSLARSTDFAVAISQQGDVAGAFFLGVAEGKWDFTLKDADSNEPGHSIRTGTLAANAAPSAWVHLVGVYDDLAHQIRLYHDGQLTAEVPFRATWQATGPLTVAVAQAHSVQADFWPGTIADVRLYASALDGSQVLAIFANSRPAAAPPPMPAPPTDALSVFRRERDAICGRGSGEIAAINASMENASEQAVAVGLREVAGVIERAEGQLHALDVPAEMAEFVAADTARRTERLRLVYAMADAFEQGDLDAADALDAELTTLNIETEAEEIVRRLVECP